MVCMHIQWTAEFSGDVEEWTVAARDEEEALSYVRQHTMHVPDSLKVVAGTCKLELPQVVAQKKVKRGSE